MGKPIEYASPTTGRAAVPSLVIWLICGYLLILPIAEVALRWNFEITRDRSRFAVINAITLTGFPASVSVDGYPESGQVTVLVLSLIGAIVPMIVGGMAVVRIIRLPYTDRQIVGSAIGACGVLTLLGAIPLIESGWSPFHAAMLSISALGNSGLAFGAVPGLFDWQTHLILMPLSIVGGLGLPVLMELHDGVRRRRALSVHSRTVLIVTAGLYLAVFAATFLLQALHAEPGEGLVAIAGSSSVAAVNSRTAGFGFQPVQGFPRGMQWIVLVAMVIGGSPAGTAGGLKTTTLVELYRGVRKALVGEAPGRSFGIAATWFGVYLGMVGGVLLLLLVTAPQLGADRLLFETVSALSNVGLSHGTIMLVSPGLDVLAVGMLLGRLAPLAILWWMAQTTEGAELAVG